jgi:hypothetical protein
LNSIILADLVFFEVQPGCIFRIGRVLTAGVEEIIRQITNNLLHKGASESAAIAKGAESALTITGR